MKINKVYLVSCGSYDDYRVCGIFSTNKKSDEYKKNLRDEIEFNPDKEFEIDSNYIKIDYKEYIYHIEMLQSGIIYGYWEEDICYRDYSNLNIGCILRPINLKYNKLCINIVATSKTEAIKTVDKLRKKILKNNNWKKGKEFNINNY